MISRSGVPFSPCTQLNSLIAPYYRALLYNTVPYHGTIGCPLNAPYRHCHAKPQHQGSDPGGVHQLRETIAWQARDAMTFAITLTAVAVFLSAAAIVILAIIVAVNPQRRPRQEPHRRPAHPHRTGHPPPARSRRPHPHRPLSIPKAICHDPLAPARHPPRRRNRPWRHWPPSGTRPPPYPVRSGRPDAGQPARPRQSADPARTAQETGPACGCATPPPGSASWPRPPPRSASPPSTAWSTPPATSPSSPPLRRRSRTPPPWSSPAVPLRVRCGGHRSGRRVAECHACTARTSSAAGWGTETSTAVPRWVVTRW